MGCGQRNIHSFRPTNTSETLLLLASYIPCLIATGIIGLVVAGYFGSFIFGFLQESAGQQSTTLIFASGLTGGGFGTILVFVSFFRTIFTSPGHVPLEPWSRPPMIVSDTNYPADHDHFVTTVTAKRELRYCRRCSIYKPDDVHHCSQCQRCVVRMDHHCPWVNNCVGRDNHKYFILFLLHISGTALFMLAHIVLAYYTTSVTFSLHNATTHLAVFLTAIMLGVFGVFMLCFGGFHLQQVRSGSCTLGPVMDHLTPREHFHEVFGYPDSWVEHLLPMAPKRVRPRNRPPTAQQQTAAVAMPQ